MGMSSMTPVTLGKPLTLRYLWIVTASLCHVYASIYFINNEFKKILYKQ